MTLGETNFINEIEQLNFFFDTSALAGGDAEDGINNLDGLDLADRLTKINEVIIANSYAIDNFDDLMDAAHTALGGAGAAPAAVKAGFVKAFKDILEIPDPTTPGNFGDWDPLEGENPDFVKLFESSFTQFLTEYEPVDTVPNMLDEWHKFMNVRAVVLNDTAVGAYANLTTYEEIYFSFNPGASQQEFFNRVISFFNEQSAGAKGYFVPSHHLERFYDDVQVEAVPDVATSLDGLNSDKTLILLEVFKLVTEMIEVLQRVTTVQAERLTFLTEWQSAYTDLIADVPVFTEGDASPISGDKSKHKDTRQNLNDKNNILRETLRSYRTIVSDRAKQLQTTINQSQEAVTQQTNISTAIIQQLSTLLQSIFR